MFDICCIGHITRDTVITPLGVKEMAGGTSWYFSQALQHMNTHYALFTSLGEPDMAAVDHLRKLGIKVHVFPSVCTVHFENVYPSNRDLRTQRVLAQADPFATAQFTGVRAKVFHLGPLLAGDIPLALIRELAGQGRVSLDVQGYLRSVQGTHVKAVDWPFKKEALRYVHYLKADDTELSLLTGQTDIRKGAKILAGWGVQEVVITLASRGSVIHDGVNFYHIPSYHPGAVIDTTGCGDTYMAGYLYLRVKGSGPEEAGHFASAMSALKTTVSGPFTGTEEEVHALIARRAADEVPGLFRP